MSEKNTLMRFYKNQFRFDISPLQEELIFEAYRKEEFKRKEVLFRQGDANTRHYLVEKGLLRLYLVDPKGKEINILFARENQIIGDLTTPEPTNFFLGTTEDSVVYSIDESGMQGLLEKLKLANQPDPNNVLRRSYILIQKRMVSLLSKTAEENYLEFQQMFPELIDRLPQYHIASYLGISPEFLSRIIAKKMLKK